MIADHRRKLKSIQFRHADIDEDDRDLVLEQNLQRLAPGGSGNEVLAEILQNHFVGEKLGRLVVHQKYVDLFMVHLEKPISDATTCE
jgi:hypothetical protein